MRPPGESQPYWETVFGLTQDGKVGSNGLPNLLQLAIVAPLADSYDPNVPVPVMKLLIVVLGRNRPFVGLQSTIMRNIARRMLGYL